MRIKQLTFRNKKVTNKTEIEKIIHSKFDWLNKAEIENATITIKGDVIIWENGVWYYGDSYFDVWKNGIFKYGTFNDGIWKGGEFVDGIFNGIWEHGIKKGGQFDLNENKIFTFSEYNKK